MSEPAIRSILDTDLYKLTMQQGVLELHQDAQAKYLFTNRRKEGVWTPKAYDVFRSGIDAMQHLAMSKSERTWLAQRCPYLKPQYIEYLSNYRYDPDEVSVELIDGEINMEINGPWHRTILWEVPLMALLSDTYFKVIDTDWNSDGQTDKIVTKSKILDGCTFADFGTRRRRQYESQERVVRVFKKHSKGFVGTSNVHLAQLHDVLPIGTMAHEWIMGHSVLSSLRHANRYALEAWQKVYGGLLGVALTDTFGTEAFFNDFDPSLARLYDGVRHDSGDPFIFAEKVERFYTRLKIDAKTKTIVFSDGLNPGKAAALKKHCDELGIKCSFGIGTNFTNDFGSKALNIVIKLRELDGIPVVKLSDDAGKATGDPDAVRVAKWTFLGEPL